MYDIFVLIKHLVCPMDSAEHITTLFNLMRSNYSLLFPVIATEMILHAPVYCMYKNVDIIYSVLMYPPEIKI